MAVYSSLLFVLLQVISTLGYSTGPGTTCESQLADHGGGALNSNSPVTVSVTPTIYYPGSVHQVTLSGGPYRGFFVQARRQSSSYGSLTEAVGQFSNPPSDTQRISCGSDTNNGWAHSNGDLKSSTKTITWTAPSTDEGPLRFRTPIVQIYNETSGDNIHWAPDVTQSVLLTYSTIPEWSVWSDWGTCTKACGSGVQYRSRDCVDPNLADNLNSCFGSSIESQDCNTQACPDPVWSEWGFFTQCSVTCGTGTQYRTRECTDPYPDDEYECEDGEEGDALGTDTRDCTEEECPVAEWGPWTPFVGCSRTCGGGTQTRTRECVDPNTSDNDVCNGADSDTEDCNTQSCPGFVDGYWGEWRSWSACSQLCDLGERTRTRTCYPSHDGCTIGSPIEAEDCFIRPCEGTGLEWNEWIPWGECSVTCGPGIRQRVRSCQDPIEEDDRCYGDSVESQACNDRCCDCGDVELENLVWIIVGIVGFFSIVGAIAACLCVCARAGFRFRNQPPRGLLDVPPPYVSSRLSQRPLYI